MSPSTPNQGMEQSGPERKSEQYRNETRKERRAREAAEKRMAKKHQKLKSDFAKAKRTGDREAILKIRDRIRQMKNC